MRSGPETAGRPRTQGLFRLPTTYSATCARAARPKCPFRATAAWRQPSVAPGRLEIRTLVGDGLRTARPTSGRAFFHDGNRALLALRCVRKRGFGTVVESRPALAFARCRGRSSGPRSDVVVEIKLACQTIGCLVCSILFASAVAGPIRVKSAAQQAFFPLKLQSFGVLSYGHLADGTLLGSNQQPEFHF